MSRDSAGCPRAPWFWRLVNWIRTWIEERSHLEGCYGEQLRQVWRQKP